MAFEKLTNSINDLNENVQAFAHSNAEYYKLEFFKKAMKGSTSLIRFLTLGFFLAIAFIFLSFAIAIFISELIGVQSAGYFIIGGFYVLLFGLVFLFGKKPIEKLMLEKFSRIFFNE